MECVICCGNSTNPTALKTCGHCFCRNCISDWIKQKKKCPLCLKNCKPKDILDLFFDIPDASNPKKKPRLSDASYQPSDKFVYRTSNFLGKFMWPVSGKVLYVEDSKIYEFKYTEKTVSLISSKPLDSLASSKFIIEIPGHFIFASNNGGLFKVNDSLVPRVLLKPEDLSLPVHSIVRVGHGLICLATARKMFLLDIQKLTEPVTVEQSTDEFSFVSLGEVKNSSEKFLVIRRCKKTNSHTLEMWKAKNNKIIQVHTFKGFEWKFGLVKPAGIQLNGNFIVACGTCHKTVMLWKVNETFQSVSDKKLSHDSLAYACELIYDEVNDDSVGLIFLGEKSLIMQTIEI
jgi:Ring finger domain